MSPQTPANIRYISMDLLRGIAVMGILTMNILSFSMPEMAVVSPQIYGGMGISDIITWLFGFILFDGKMRGLFCLLFGASMMMLIMRTEEKGENSAKAHYNRMIWLMVFGLLHFFFIWYGDILFLYAVMGCFLYLMHHMRIKALLKWALGLFLGCTIILSLLMGSLLLSQDKAQNANATAQEIEEFELLIQDSSINQDSINSEIIIHKGSYSGIVYEKITQQYWQPLAIIMTGFTETLPFMMIGMALFKSGFLTGNVSPETYRRTIYWGLLGGGLLYALLGAAIIISGYDIVLAINIHQAWSAIPRLMMSVGYAALIITILQHNHSNSLTLHIAAVGRMAFSNYIGTSIIMTSIFYGYGLGLFGDISRTGLIPFVIGGWAAMLLWSKPWLMHFHYGPLEWLWRSLSRGKAQPFKRASI